MQCFWLAILIRFTIFDFKRLRIQQRQDQEIIQFEADLPTS